MPSINNSKVYYDEEGREYYQGKDIPSAREDPYRSYDRRPDTRNGYAHGAPVSQTLPADYRKSRVGGGAPPVVTSGAASAVEREFQAKGYQVVKEELFDPHTGQLRNIRENPYSTGARPDKDRSRKPKYVDDGAVIPNGYSYDNRGFEFKEDDYYKNRGYPYSRSEDMSDGAPPPRDDTYLPSKWIFVFLALAFITFAILNVLFCFEFHNYHRFWIAGMCLFMAFFGFYHNGDYRESLKTITYVGAGFLTNVACIVGFAFLMDKLTDDWRCVALLDGKVLKAYDALRGNDTNLAKTYGDSVNRLCFTVDFLTIGLLFLGMYSLTTSILVSDQQWRKKSRRSATEIAPFCLPRLFNPYGQVQIGQAAIVVGIVTVYGCYDYREDRNWQDTWAPIWSGGMTIFSGSLSVFAFLGRASTERACVAIFAQILTSLTLVAAITLCIIGVVRNINTVADVNDNKVIDEISTFRGCGIPTSAEYYKDEAIASAVLFAVAISILLVALFYSISQILRHISNISNREMNNNRREKLDSLAFQDRWLEHSAKHSKPRSYEDSLQNSRLGLKYEPHYSKERVSPPHFERRY